MAWEALDYQVEAGNQGFDILFNYGLVYFNMEERTGKTVSALYTVEKTKKKQCIVLTKKSAIDGIDGKSGWNEALRQCAHWLTKEYIVVNYELAHKYIGLGDIIILDEPHAFLSSFPPQPAGIIQKRVRKLCENKPVLFLSATHSAQGKKHLFRQLQCSSFSPWKHFETAQKWYDRYAERDEGGKFFYMRTGTGDFVKDYRKVLNAQAQLDVDHIFVNKTRSELGFKKEPIDILHYVDLDVSTRDAYNAIMKNKVLFFTANDKSYKFLLDSSIKESVALHMLEGGVIKVKDEYINLKAHEKITYIFDNWGDSEDVCIMYNYIAEGDKLREHFSNALILQGTRYAEGVDLSHIKTLIIYSQDFSTSRHSQRRARQANINRTDDIEVHFLLVKEAVSEQVYQTVSVNKENFIDSLFKKREVQ